MIISNTGDTGSDKAMEEVESEELIKETAHLIGGVSPSMKFNLGSIDFSTP